MSDESARRAFLFLLASARHGGNTELLARRAAAALPVAAQIWTRLSDAALETFEDVRHGGNELYPPPHGAAKKLVDATLSASDLVVAAPLYWYALPASVKLYLDHWSGWMRVPGLRFKERMAGKTMWVISVFSDEDPRSAAPLFDTLRLTADYMGMRWGGALLGKGDRPGDVLADSDALRQADRFF